MWPTGQRRRTRRDWFDTLQIVLTETSETSGMFRSDTIQMTNIVLVVGDSVLSWGRTTRCMVYSDALGTNEVLSDTALAIEIRSNRAC